MRRVGLGVGVGAAAAAAAAAAGTAVVVLVVVMITGAVVVVDHDHFSVRLYLDVGTSLSSPARLRSAGSKAFRPEGHSLLALVPPSAHSTCRSTGRP